MVVLLEEETPLQEGTEVLEMLVSDTLGSPASALAAVEKAPQVPAGWVDELEQIIAQGWRWAARPDTFLDELGIQKSA